MPPDTCDQDEQDISVVSREGDEVRTDKANAQAVAGRQDASERPVKKARRGKYISRACTYCQQRKVKCEGGEPCVQCIAKKRRCVSSRVQSEQQPEAYGLEAATASADIPVNEILARLAVLESRFPPAPPSGSHSDVAGIQKDLLEGISTNDRAETSSTKLQNTLEIDGQTFAGEMSMTPAFEDEFDNLRSANATSPRIFIEYPSPGSSLHRSTTRGMVDWLESILAGHGVVADEKQWRHDLQFYMDEINPFYPFLHPPSIWKIFNEMWEASSAWQQVEAAAQKQRRLSVALVFMCLSVGRCCSLPSASNTTAVYISGWSLYSVGTSLLQGVMETSGTTTKSLVMIQALIVRVLYLFRLDANQQAAQVLSLTVCIAHNIGMHRQSTLDTMPAFRNQLYCRTWWAIYIIDRRIAVESGNPFLIYDENIGTSLPIDLSDEWMGRFATRNETIADLQHEVASEIARDSQISCIPYFLTMIRYARVAGKAWQVCYSVNSPRTSNLVEYLDMVLCRLLETCPKHLRYCPKTPSELQFRTSPRWQIKQTLILFTSCTYLRLLVRRPSLLSSKAPNCTIDQFEPAAAACARLATNILNTHQNIKDKSLKYGFSLSHYLTSCTMVMLGLVSRDAGFKERYGETVLEATRSLQVYCQRNWVSEKMSRLVSRLSQLAQKALSESASTNRSPQISEPMRRDSIAEKRIAPQINNTQIPPTRHHSEIDTFTSGVNRKGKWTQSAYPGDAFGTSDAPQYASAARSEATGISSVIRPTFDDRVSWGMSDFNFEAIDGSGNIMAIEPGHSAPSDDMRLNGIGVDNSNRNRNLEECSVSGLESGNPIDFDLDMDFSVTNLWDTTMVLDLDILE